MIYLVLIILTKKSMKQEQINSFIFLRNIINSFASFSERQKVGDVFGVYFFASGIYNFMNAINSKSSNFYSLIFFFFLVNLILPCIENYKLYPNPDT